MRNLDKTPVTDIDSLHGSYCGNCRGPIQLSRLIFPTTLSSASMCSQCSVLQLSTFMDVLEGFLYFHRGASKEPYHCDTHIPAVIRKPVIQGHQNEGTPFYVLTPESCLPAHESPE